MFTILTAIALSVSAQADCGARLLRVSDDQAWLLDDVRAVVRTDRATPGVERWLIDLGESGCGPDGTCAPILDADWQPDRTTAFFEGHVEGHLVTPGTTLTARLHIDDGRTFATGVRARTGGHANLHTVPVEGANLVLTRPVLQPQPSGTRIVVRAVGTDAARIRSLSLTLGETSLTTLVRTQVHRVAEGEARADLGIAHRTGAATLVGLDASGSEVCFQKLSAELDLGWQDPA